MIIDVVRDGGVSLSGSAIIFCESKNSNFDRYDFLGVGSIPGTENLFFYFFIKFVSDKA
jgi:hypothetical protein